MYLGTAQNLLPDKKSSLWLGITILASPTFARRTLKKWKESLPSHSTLNCTKMEHEEKNLFESCAHERDSDCNSASSGAYIRVKWKIKRLSSPFSIRRTHDNDDGTLKFNSLFSNFFSRRLFNKYFYVDDWKRIWWCTTSFHLCVRLTLSFVW